MSELEITNNKIYVGIPRERFGMHEFLDQRDQILATLNAAGALAAGNLIQVTSHRVDINRERITESFLEQSDKPDWLLMIDSDMHHHPECGLMLRERKVPIIGGLYYHRSPSRFHDPLAFKLHEERLDDDGYLVAYWNPIRDYIHEFMEKYGVPIQSGGYIIKSPPEDSLVEVDAVGTGCMMIHRSVFEGMDKPYWEYRTRRGSEDMDFCFRAQKAGFPIYVDLAVVAGHFKLKPVGHNEFMKFYRVRGVWQTEYGEKQAVEWLEKYSWIDSPDEAMKEYHPDKLAELWNKSYPMHGAYGFYTRESTGNMYLKDLLWWNASAIFRSLRGNLIGLEGINVLDFGSGIGTISMQMALQNNDVVSVEINDILREFAEKRWEEQLADRYSDILGEIRFEKRIYKEDNNSFDLIIAVDVLEHLEVPDLTTYAYTFARLLKTGGRLFAHNNWGQQDIYPMHYDHSELWKQLTKEVGSFQIEDLWWVKIK